MKRLINNLSRSQKITILVAIDSLVIISSIVMSFLIRLDFYSVIVNLKILLFLSILVTPPIILTLYFSNFYLSITRYGGLSIFKSILLSSILGSIILTLIIYYGNFSFKIGIFNEPTNMIRSIPILFLLFLVFLLIASRYFVQILIDSLFSDTSYYPIAVYSYSKNLLKLANFLEDNFNLKIKVFLSSSNVFFGSFINKVPVVDINNNESLNNLDIKYIVVVDLPSNIDQRSEVLEKLTSFNCTIKFLNFNQTNKIPFENKLFEEIDIDLLLSRQKVDINFSIISEFFYKKTILVTGGGGSIGSELCLQLLKFNIKKLVILDSSEFNLYNIKNRVNDLKIENIIIEYKLLDITHNDQLDLIFKNENIDIVYHASAYKHVVFGGENYINFFKNNLLGTKYLLDCCVNHKVKSFMLVSTDKASSPTNIMGLTKLLSENLCDNYQSIYSDIIINKVRFGNVLGTSGSVIPLFKEQILKGGPVTVSDKNVSRYFMTKDEAVELILYASKLGKSNELFFLDMGKPIKIYDIATKMISLLGRKVENSVSNNGNNIKIIYKGLEPGEKMDEIVHFGKLKDTEHPRIFISNEENTVKIEMKLLENIFEYLKNDTIKLKNLIKENYPEIKDL